MLLFLNKWSGIHQNVYPNAHVNYVQCRAVIAPERPKIFKGDREATPCST